MDFSITRKETVLLNPLKQMERRAIASEIRRDALTGRTSRVCHFMALKWEKPDFQRLVAGTDTRCPFCAERILSVTPQFPPELLPEGRLVSGEAVLFPNLAPYDSLSAVATFDSRHYVPMTGFSVETIAAGIGLALSFFSRMHSLGHPESRLHLINWNYMPPAGSSLIHPHLQVFVSADAPNLLRQEIEGAKRYRQATGRLYWDELVEFEQRHGERFLGRIGRTSWLSAFAPMGVAGDVLAVSDAVASTLELSEQDICDIAQGLVRAMVAYDAMGIYSFNMNFFASAPEDPDFRFHLLFSPRTFFNQALGTTDVGALRNLFNETVCMARPEDIAAMLRPYFA